MKRERKELLLSTWYIIRLAGWYSIRLAIAKTIQLYWGILKAKIISRSNNKKNMEDSIDQINQGIIHLKHAF